MTVTVQDVMRHVRHYYAVRVVRREWLTEGGALYPKDAVTPGGWIAIADGPFPGVYQLDEAGCIPGLPDRRWTGNIHLLEPPEDFLRLCRTIAEWAEKHDPAVASERLGAYSASYDSGIWQEVFAAALTPYKRMYPEVRL